MRVLTLGSLALLSLPLQSCDNEATVRSTEGKELTITVPTMDVDVEQGKTVRFAIGIERTGFTDAVEISFANLPEGVDIAGGGGSIASGTTEREFTLRASATAAVVSEHAVQVTAKGPDGMTVSKDMQVTISAIE